MRKVPGVLPLVALGCWFCLSCTSESSSAGAAASSGAAGGAAGSSFGQGACAACLQQTCAPSLTTCQSDPGCAAWLQCVYDCPTAADGSPEPACEGQCPVAPGSATAQAKKGFEACWRFGAGADCAPCGHATDAGSDDASQNPILHQSCPASTETNPCWICEDEKCCNTYAQCHQNQDCTAIVDCMKADPDAGTAWDDLHVCASGHPAGEQDYLNRMGCIMIYCTVQCGASYDACLACSQEKCADVYLACYTLPACNAIMGCVEPCGNDTNCADTCLAAHPTGSSAFGNYALCIIGRCQSVCQ
jgi:hypothetical protein